MTIKHTTFFKIMKMSFFLLLAIAQGPAPASAQTFLVPYDYEQQGNVYMVYPSYQRYVYTDNPIFVSKRQPLQDGNEEDEYFKQKEQKSKKAQNSVVLLPIKQIISKQAPVEGISAKSSETKKENRNVSTIAFDFDKANIKDSEIQKLAGILNNLKQADEILVKGYTDKIGTEEYNDKLALRRVESVKNYLTSQGINDSKIKIEAKGKCCYISDENSKNRRVEIWIEAETGKISLQSGSRP